MSIVCCFGRNANGELGSAPSPAAQTGATASAAAASSISGGGGGGGSGGGAGGSSGSSMHFVTLPTSPRAIGTGLFHTMAVTVTGELYVWGAGSGGQLGRPKVAEHPFGAVTTAVVGDVAPVALLGELAAGAAGGRNHTLAVSVSGHLFSWGRAAAGQLGHGIGTSVGGTRRIADADLTEPKALQPPVGMSASKMLPRMACVRAGEHFSAALARDTWEVFTWGCDANGRLGRTGSERDAAEPRPLPRTLFAGQAVVALACGWRHVLAATEAGLCYSWGAGDCGQLGRGSVHDGSTPAPIEVIAS